MSTDARRFQTLDVRAMLARGEEPYAKIMKAIDALKPNEGLTLLTPFLPSPLIERMQSAGYTARPERRADGAWQTFFWRD